MRHLRVGKVVVDRRSRTRNGMGAQRLQRAALVPDCQTDPKLEAPVGLRGEQNFLFPHRGGTLWILNKSRAWLRYRSEFANDRAS
jgi:hypothetical protein